MKAIAVDDEIYMLETLEEAVRASYDIDHVEAFTACSTALAYAEENPIDVAFLDINMREMSGIILARKLKEIYPKVNIVFVTGYSQYTGEAFSMHASGYVYKPATAEKIQNEMENLSLEDRLNELVNFRRSLAQYYDSYSDEYNSFLERVEKETDLW